MEEKRKPRAWICWVVAVLVFVVYPLSIGPVGALRRRGYVSAEAATVIVVLYTPVGFVVRNSPMPVLRVIEWYLNWWEQIIPSPARSLGSD